MFLYSVFSFAFYSLLNVRNLLPPEATVDLRVFQSTMHFQLFTLPNSAIALSLLDPQHLRYMAVFSDTEKRLWGLCLFTRCSRPRVLTLRAGWSTLKTWWVVIFQPHAYVTPFTRLLFQNLRRRFFYANSREFHRNLPHFTSPTKSDDRT